MNKSIAVIAATALLAGTLPAALAAEQEEVTLGKCAQSYGTIAVVEGNTQGWSDYGLGSPRELINSVRALRAGTDLTPTGKRDGLFIEVKDSYGTQGWVSVEDLG
jgi:hypothetical protein